MINANGLFKIGYAITSALNRPEAENDWIRARRIAEERGFNKLAEKLAPDFSKTHYWGIKRIDKQTCKLLRNVGYTVEQVKQENFGCWYQWHK